MENNRKRKQNILITSEAFFLRLKSDTLNYKGNNEHINFNKNLQLLFVTVVKHRLGKYRHNKRLMSKVNISANQVLFKNKKTRCLIYDWVKEQQLVNNLRGKH